MVISCLNTMTKGKDGFTGLQSRNTTIKLQRTVNTQNQWKGGSVMKDMETPHKRVLEFCDCYAETDPLKEMAFVHSDDDKDEAALKWIALAILHGVDRNAKEISLARGASGDVEVRAVYNDMGLPSPGKEIGAKIVEAVRQITHIEEGSGEIPLAMGIRDSSLELKVTVKQEGNQDTITIKFGK
jgi:hypothetical protein